MSALFVDLQIAVRSLFQHRRRTAFLGLAIAGITALLLLLGGLSQGIRRTMVETATTLSSGHLNVGGFFKVTAGQSFPLVTDYARVVEVTRKALPEMTFSVQRGRGWAKVISDQGSIQAGIAGIDIAHEPAFKDVLQIVSGRLEDLAQPGTILVFQDQLKKLGVKVGDAMTISAQTSRGISNTVDVRVVAIARDVGLMSRFNTFVPIQTLRALYQIRPDVTGVVQIHLPDDQTGNLPALAARLRNALSNAGYRVMDPNPQAFWMKFNSVNREEWTGQKLDVTSWEDELSFMTWTLEVLKWLSRVLMVILIAIVVTGIMNTMWIAIRERTREIGTLRAIGMQRAGVLRMFLLESLCLGLLGTLIGAVVGALVAAALNAAQIPVPLSVQLFLMSDTLRLAIEPAAYVKAILLITGITGAAALFPALRAARLQPVTAMAHFG